MTDLRTATTEELQAELARREKEARPKPLDRPDWAPLIKLCEQQLDDVQAGESTDDSDLDHYIYEEALIAVYGPDIFTWMNERTP